MIKQDKLDQESLDSVIQDFYYEIGDQEEKKTLAHEIMALRMKYGLSPVKLEGAEIYLIKQEKEG